MSERSVGEKIDLWEEDILLAVATAQGVLIEAARQILVRDKHDGIRAVKWLEAHSDLYREIANECRLSCGVGEAALSKADKLAHENED